MAETDSNRLLGRLAIHFKLLSKEKVAEALRKWRQSGEVVDFGVFLISEDFLSSDKVKKLLRARQQYLEREAEKQGSQDEAATPAAADRPLAPPATVEPSPAAIGLAPPASETAAVEIAAPDATSAEVAAEAPLEPAVSEGFLAFDDTVPVVPPTPAVTTPPPAAPIALEAEPVAQPAAAQPAAAQPAAPQPATSPSAAARQTAAQQAPSPPPPVLEADEGGLRTPIDTTPPTGEEAAAAFQTHPQFRLRLEQGTTLEDLLRQTRQLGASDLHVHSGARLKVRLHGELLDTSGLLAPSVATQLILGMLDDAQRHALETRQQLDFSYEIPGVGRFRANTYLQQRGLDAVFRAIPPFPPTLAELGLPESLAGLASYHQGLVLFTGPAGCGKSSTMAAMVRMINEQRPDHIITVEDPIEYVHASQRCIVNQRQVGPHTGSFARALRGALREDPDIIVIGEMRDLETISLALTAAETGHLVLGTLHTSSAIRTINRLLGVFPPDQQAQIRTMVSESLRGVVSQRLVRRADGQGRVAALEVMINNKAVGNLIRENKTFQIHSAIQTGSSQGMCLLDSSLLQLLKEGVISKEEAQGQAEKPESFQ